MEPESVSTNSSSNKNELSSRMAAHNEDLGGADQEEPFSLSSTSVALLGMTIAIATLGIPMAAVLTEQPLRRDSIVPTDLELDGSKPSASVTFTRAGKSGSRDSSRK